MQHPTAPADPDRFTSLGVCMNRQAGPSIVADGWWLIGVAADWWTVDGDVYVSVEVPLQRLMSDEFAVLSEFTDPLW